MWRAIWIGWAIMAGTISSAALASEPAVKGQLQGLELAQQTVINPAIFVGVFTGSVGGWPAAGVWAAGVEHEVPLPSMPGESIDITGGAWQLQLWVLQGFRLRRVNLNGGLAGDLTLFDTDLFAIRAIMQVISGGTGEILLDGVLDHTVFPPAVTGVLQ